MCKPALVSIACNIIQYNLLVTGETGNDREKKGGGGGNHCSAKCLDISHAGSVTCAYVNDNNNLCSQCKS